MRIKSTASTCSNDSPRGPDINGNSCDKDLSCNVDNPLTRLTRQGQEAITELERILFFTDLPDDASVHQAAKEGLDAIEKVENLLLVHQHSNNSSHHRRLHAVGGDDEYAALPHWDSVSTAGASCRVRIGQKNCSCGVGGDRNESQALALPSLVNLTEYFKKQFQHALETGQQAIKETERIVLFTDLDEAKLADDMDGLSANGEVWTEVEVVLQDVERKLKYFKKEVGLRSHKAYKECERTLLFTDLDEVALAKDRTNDDLISHFLYNQQVGQELEQKFQRSLPSQVGQSDIVTIGEATTLTT